jgi:DNA polymerase III delta prime subunit
MVFNSFGEIVDFVNKRLNAFADQFGTERKRLAYLGKRPKRGRLFVYDKKTKRNWAINEGGGIEIQYHLGLDIKSKIIYYGLGFNTQYVPFANQKTMVDYAKPFMNAFLEKEKEIMALLPKYNFITGDINDLKKPQDNRYTLFGKELKINSSVNQIIINNDDLEELLKDLKNQFKAYVLIFETKNMTTYINREIQDITSLLLYKKQIILQGPPGTGKTKLAKEIAESLIKGEKSEDVVLVLSDKNIIDVLNKVTIIPTAANQTSYELLGIDTSKKEVLLKKGTGKEDNTPFEKIKEHYKALSWEERIPSNDARRAIAIAKFIFDKIGGGVNLETNQAEQFRLIQFHPSYTYEDFVRGIISKPNPDGTGIIYEAQNKVLANFAYDALQNWKAFNNPTTLSNEKWLQDTIDDFLEHLSEKTDAEPKSIKLTEKTYISRVTENTIRYNSDVWEVDGGVPISDLIKMYDSNITTRNQVKSLSSLTKTAKHLPSYWIKILELFKRYIADNNLKPQENVQSEKLKKYVLVIDEINRANLSSVLGELIYALEYRGENVDSMYEVLGNNKLMLPSNLYIIGTMNTADRSVGHIDYAIRRRFAFVDISPKILFDVPFEIELFKQVTALFIKDTDTLKPSIHLSAEFRPQDVWLGHSYFIKKDEVDSKIRLKYEIIPILEEYIKDGVIKESDELKIAIGNLENFLQ